MTDEELSVLEMLLGAIRDSATEMILEIETFPDFTDGPRFDQEMIILQGYVRDIRKSLTTLQCFATLRQQLRERKEIEQPYGI